VDQDRRCILLQFEVTSDPLIRPSIQSPGLLHIQRNLFLFRYLTLNLGPYSSRWGTLHRLGCGPCPDTLLTLE
jgi:hypothetical protein